MNGIEAVTSWFTPTILFCIVTLLIETIFMRNPHRNQLNLTEEEHRPPLYNVLDQVKSFKFSNHRSESRPDPIEHTTIAPAEPAQQYEESINHVKRSKYENMEISEAKSKSKSKSIARLLKKSFSEKFKAKEKLSEEEVEDHRPVTAREKTTASNGENEAVDENADDFL